MSGTQNTFLLSTALSTAFALALALAAPVSAEEGSVTVGGSYNIFDDEREVDDEGAGFGALEIKLSERWSGEFWLSYGETDGDNGFDADTTRWHLDALYYLKTDGKLRPYLAGGAGQLDRDWDVPNGNLDKVDEEVNFGGGVRWFVSDRLSLRGDARYLYGFDDSTSDFTVSLGLSLHFGGQQRKAAPPPPPEPEPAAEPEPLDSDGDGVIDDNDACPGTPAGRRVDARGCEPRFVRGESVQLQVNFAFDSDAVDTRYLDDIKALADFMKRHTDVTAEIEAHTDSMGPEAYNQGLSQRRAESVIDVLVNRFGIASSRLIPRGYGESRPIASNDTEQGRAENRRVMVNLSTEDQME